MRRTATEKQEIIRLVEESDLSVCQTLRELGICRGTFYGWYSRYVEDGLDGLAAGVCLFVFISLAAKRAELANISPVYGDSTYLKYSRITGTACYSSKGISPPNNYQGGYVRYRTIQTGTSQDEFEIFAFIYLKINGRCIFLSRPPDPSSRWLSSAVGDENHSVC